MIEDASAKYGAQCIVVAIDAKRRTSEERRRPAARAGTCTATAAARTPAWTPWQWATEMARRGAGEILLTSMDRDGTKSGFDLALTRAVSDAVSVPVIASGGVGSLDDLADGIQKGGADAVLAASIFHYGEYTVGRPKAQHGRARHSGARSLSPCRNLQDESSGASMNWLDEVKWDAQGPDPGHRAGSTAATMC